MLMDLDVLPSAPVSLFAEACVANAIEKAVVDLSRNVSPSYPSASHAADDPSLAGSDDNRSLAVGEGSISSEIARQAAFAPLIVAGVVLLEANSASVTRSTLLTNQPSAVVASNRKAESKSSPKSDSGDIKLGVKRESKAIKNSEKTGRRNEVVFSTGKLKLRFRSPQLLLLQLVRLLAYCILMTFALLMWTMMVR